jgi:hypothetical protein
VDVRAGVCLPLGKEPHDSLDPTNVARRYDMEDAHPVLPGAPL